MASNRQQFYHVPNYSYIHYKNYGDMLQDKLRLICNISSLTSLILKTVDYATDPKIDSQNIFTKTIAIIRQ